MQNIKTHIVVNTAIAQVNPELSPKLGQHVERVAYSHEATPPIKIPTPGILAGKIRLKDDFDAPLPDDLREAFEGTSVDVAHPT